MSSKRKHEEESKTSKKKSKSTPLHLPGYKFCGPGTDLEVGASPVNTLDAACKQHDEAYADPRVKTDVADKQLIKAAISEHTLAGVVVAGAIKGKSLVDKYVYDTDKILRADVIKETTSQEIKQATMSGGKVGKTKPKKLTVHTLGSYLDELIREAETAKGAAAEMEQDISEGEVGAQTENSGTGGAGKVAQGNVGYNIDPRKLQSWKITTLDDGTTELRCVRRYCWWQVQKPETVHTKFHDDTYRHANLCVLPSGLVLHAINDEQYRTLRESHTQWRFKEQTVYVDNILESDDTKLVTAAGEYVTQTVYKPVMRHMLYDGKYGEISKVSDNLNDYHSAKMEYRQKFRTYAPYYDDEYDQGPIGGIFGNELEHVMLNWKNYGALKQMNGTTQRGQHLIDLKMDMDTCQMGDGFRYNVTPVNNGWMSTGAPTKEGYSLTAKTDTCITVGATNNVAAWDSTRAESWHKEGYATSELHGLLYDDDWRYNLYNGYEDQSVVSAYKDGRAIASGPNQEILVLADQWHTRQIIDYSYRYTVFYENVFQFKGKIPKNLQGFHRLPKDLTVDTSVTPNKAAYLGRRYRLAARPMATGDQFGVHLQVPCDPYGHKYFTAKPTRANYDWNSVGLKTVDASGRVQKPKKTAQEVRALRDAARVIVEEIGAEVEIE